MKRVLCVTKYYICVCAVLHLHRNKITTFATMAKTLQAWKFKHPPSYSELPIDKNPEYNIPVAVKNAVFSKVPVEPLQGTLHLVCASDDALSDLLDLDPEVAQSEQFVKFIAGIYLPDGGLTVCHRYGGYQFGIWADQLGDGRAHILGEYVNSKNETWQPQLKGSGETPYSRMGDGRAVLRSSIREMIASEACHYLGIPTTRAVALVVSDDHKVWRDKSYTGFSKQERAAIVMRLAQAWYRLGSVEILLKRKEPELLKTLVDFIIKHHFSDIDSDAVDKYVQFYKHVSFRNLDLVAKWQGFGFTHGVLNTDNVSILGLTIDYGPYGFIDHYYSNYVPNTSDDLGRYAFHKQPEVMIWNLHKFAEALEPILEDEQKQEIKSIGEKFDEYVNEKILNTYLKKLGLSERQDKDKEMVLQLFDMMEDKMADFTATFRQLAEVDISDLLETSELESKWSLKKLSEANKWKEWVTNYKCRLEKEGVTEDTRKERMQRVNPVYVPRNWIMQEAIKDAENNNFEKVRFLLKILKTPYRTNEEAEKQGFSSQPPSWSYGLKLSCSS